MIRTEILISGGYSALPQVTLRDTILRPAAKLVLMSLIDRLGENEVAWPSTATIAEDTGLSERGVEKCLQKLQESGIISDAGKYYRSTKWEIISVQSATSKAHTVRLQSEQSAPSSTEGENPKAHTVRSESAQSAPSERTEFGPKRTECCAIELPKEQLNGTTEGTTEGSAALGGTDNSAPIPGASLSFFGAAESVPAGTLTATNVPNQNNEKDRNRTGTTQPAPIGTVEDDDDGYRGTYSPAPLPPVTRAVQVARPAKSEPVAARKSDKLTELELRHICSSRDTMEAYLLWGKEYALDPTGEKYPTRFNWRVNIKDLSIFTEENVNVSKWTFKQLAGFFWFRVSLWRGNRNIAQGMPSWGRLFGEIKTLHQRCGGNWRTIQYLNVITHQFELMCVLAGRIADTFMLDERSLSNSLIAQQVDMFLNLPPESQKELYDRHEPELLMRVARFKRRAAA